MNNIDRRPQTGLAVLRTGHRLSTRLCLGLSLSLAVLLGQAQGTAAQSELSEPVETALAAGITAFGERAGQDYGRFAAHAGRMADRFSKASCSSLADMPEADDLIASFRKAYTAWAQVQPIGFGPVVEYDRRPRIQFFPDKRNTGSRLLAKTLLAEDPDLLEPYGLTFASIGIQGFHTLERLLFDADFTELAAKPYGCAFRNKVSSVIARMAQELADAWADPARGFIDYGGVANQSSAILAGLDGYLAAVVRRHLTDPLGGSIETAKPRAAEAARAELSTVLLSYSMSSAAILYNESFDAAIRAVDADLADQITARFADVQTEVSALNAPISKLVLDPEGREQVFELAEHVEDLRMLATVSVADRLGLILGFNAQDGD